MARHGAILKRLNQKRRELERFNEESEAVRAQLAMTFAPLAEETQSLDDEVHSLFEKILKSPKRFKRSAREIEELYWELQVARTISRRSERDDLDERDVFAGEANPYGDEPDRPHAEAEPAQVARDSHRGRGGDKRNFRALFLKLAAELHPDKVQDGDEKERRTELMKELNRAYRDGDMARILEIESSMEEFLEFLREVRDFTLSFVTGKISLDEFLDGPDGPNDVDDIFSAAENDCDCPECTALRELALLHILEVTEGMMGSSAQGRSGRAKAGSKAARKRQKAARKKNNTSRKK